ncbi:hypothetical protein N1851_024102 [Merluccius polli]|uniref:Integrase zinc-binding domain-containing protein n=1 Tax=Merluccius polli TaxID=89951 RepID=A0AA47NX60_MERPO|nr:hypothetical protein N1851_024102 [Merluccius polli]
MEKYRMTEKKPLTLDNLVTAESEIIQFSQRQQFGEEIKALQKSKQVSRNSQLFKLDPILQDGTLRVGRRLNKSAMPENAKHQKNRTLRCKYWIPQANSAIRRLLNKCVVCRRISEKVGEQKMANLPEERLLPDKPPFTNTGVDYYGPFDVKRAGVQSKAMACYSPASSSELCTSRLQTASKQTPASIRFAVCRRGQFTIMRSDNGTNLVGAERELREAIQYLDNDKIERALHPKGIKWIFNNPAGSHQGGVCERQI